MYGKHINLTRSKAHIAMYKAMFNRKITSPIVSRPLNRYGIGTIDSLDGQVLYHECRKTTSILWCRTLAIPPVAMVKVK